MVSLVRHGGTIPTYSLTVDTVHTFYVEAGDTPVLVHNCNLGDHEGVNGGHTIERHVGKEDSYLIGRTTGRRAIENASSFTDLHGAEIETQANLDAHAPGIEWWLENSADNQITIESPLVDPAHVAVYNGSSASWRPGRSVVTVLKRDPGMPDGYSIFTSYGNP